MLLDYLQDVFVPGNITFLGGGGGGGGGGWEFLLSEVLLSGALYGLAPNTKFAEICR